MIAKKSLVRISMTVPRAQVDCVNAEVVSDATGNGVWESLWVGRNPDPSLLLPHNDLKVLYGIQDFIQISDVVHFSIVDSWSRFNDKHGCMGHGKESHFLNKIDFFWQIQSKPVNTDTKGSIESVHIKRIVVTVKRHLLLEENAKEIKRVFNFQSSIFLYSHYIRCM